MTRITIEKISDSHECETCGFSSANGARIYLDGLFHSELTPMAYCFDGTDYDDDAIFREILRALKLNVVYSSEEGYCRRLILSLGHTIEIIHE